MVRVRVREMNITWDPGDGGGNRIAARGGMRINVLGRDQKGV